MTVKLGCVCLAAGKRSLEVPLLRQAADSLTRCIDMMMKKLIICVNNRPLGGEPSCGGRGSELLAEEVETMVSDQGLPIVVERSVCLGHCTMGPNARLVPGGDIIHGSTLQVLQEAIADFLVENSN